VFLLDNLEIKVQKIPKEFSITNKHKEYERHEGYRINTMRNRRVESTGFPYPQITCRLIL
jgi:hypothetical protein